MRVCSASIARLIVGHGKLERILDRRGFRGKRVRLLDLVIGLLDEPFLESLIRK